jgi:8-oxo-dGTP pyrophosphatase MutT (NUDIX family)
VPHRTIIINLLENYKTYNNTENITKNNFLYFIKNNSNCFERSNLKGHITASAWLLSPDHKQVLLTHHKKIGRWLQLGGHADGDSDIKKVALKEAHEESGIAQIKFFSEEIFDIDIHYIAAHKNTPAHYHSEL